MKKFPIKIADFDDEATILRKPDVPEHRYVCTSCETVFDDDEDEPIYECSSCGALFSRSGSYDGDGHQCPDCKRFGSKFAEHGCPTCQTELEYMLVKWDAGNQEWVPNL